MLNKGALIRPIIIYVVSAFILIAGASVKAGEINVNTEKNTCRYCHGAEGRLFERSVHERFAVTCASCHGGDSTAIEKNAAMSPEKGFKGKLTRGQVPLLCDSCHGNYFKMRQYGIPSTQLQEYKTSVHGQKLFQNGDANVAICTSCHNTHDIVRVSSTESPVYPSNIPKTCAKCHADAALMKKYNLDTTEFNNYKKSVHGRQLMEMGNLSAPSCSSCHGSHGAAPPGGNEVVGICGKCHIDNRDNYVQSTHFKKGILCVNCHSNHHITADVNSLYVSDKKEACVTCHKDKTSKAGLFIAKMLELRTISVMKLKDADKDIKKAAGDGMNIYALEDMYATATKGMKKFGAVQHQLSEKASEDMLSREVNTFAEQIQTDVEDFYSARLNSRIIALIIILCFSLTIFVVYIRYSILKKRKSGSNNK